MLINNQIHKILASLSGLSNLTNLRLMVSNDLGLFGLSVDDDFDTDPDYDSAVKCCLYLQCHKTGKPFKEIEIHLETGSEKAPKGWRRPGPPFRAFGSCWFGDREFIASFSAKGELTMKGERRALGDDEEGSIPSSYEGESSLDSDSD